MAIKRVCDECGKEICKDDQHYDLSLGIIKRNDRVNNLDGEYCSDSCMIKALTNWLHTKQS